MKTIKLIYEKISLCFFLLLVFVGVEILAENILAFLLGFTTIWIPLLSLIWFIGMLKYLLWEYEIFIIQKRNIV